MIELLARAQTGATALPESPYVGLVPFREDDAGFFFGREPEKEIVTGNLRASRLTILYGASGVGKTSLLRAGVVHDLREQIRETAAGRPERAPVACCIFRAWRDLPLAALTAAIGESVAEALGNGAAVAPRGDAPFVDSLRAWTTQVRTLLVVLDQFEDYFLYHPDEDGDGTFATEFPRALEDPNLRVHFLVSIREDSWAKLDRFEGRIPRLFANYVRVEALGREAARRAIEGPIDAWNARLPAGAPPYGIEPALTDTVIEEAAADRRPFATGHDSGVPEAGVDDVQPPFLQLVMGKLWQATIAADDHVLGIARLAGLGGPRRIVENHLKDSLAVLTHEEQAVASDVFRFLVTRSHTKIAHSAADLAEWTKRPEPEVTAVLDKLCTPEAGRILRAVVPPAELGDERRYEIYHDVLAEPIVAWRNVRGLEEERALARRRQRRLAVIAGLAVVGLAIVAALAVAAFVSERNAKTAKRHAQAGELDATALQRVSVNPHASVQLALDAASLVHDDAQASVLRQTLIADRLRYFRYLPGKVRGVAMSPDGTLLAAAVEARRVVLVDRNTRKVVRTIKPPSSVGEVGFLNGGTQLVSSSQQGIAQVWNVADGTRVLEGQPVAAAQAPDGSLLLVPLRGDLRGVIAHTHRLVAAPGGGAVAAAVQSRDGTVQAWLFRPDGTLVRTLPGIGVKDVAFSPNGELLASTGATGLTELWDARTGQNVYEFVDAKLPTNAVAFSPDSKLLATGSEDSTIRVYDTTTYKRKFFLFGHLNPVTGIAWSPDGRLLASASDDQTVRIWRVRTHIGSGTTAATLAGNGGTVTTLAFSRNSTELVTGGDDTSLRIWNVRPDATLRLLGGAPGRALDARWAGSTIVSLWSSGVVKTYDPATRRRTHVLRVAPPQKLTALGVSGDASVIAAAGTDRTNLWNGSTGTTLPSVAGGASVVAVSRDGNLVATGADSGTVRVWEAATANVLWSQHVVGKVEDVEFSTDGSKLVTADAAGSAIWAVRTGRRLHALPSPRGDDRAVFSADGALVATAGLDSDVRIWHAGTGQLDRVLKGHAHAVRDVVFDAGGTRLATAGDDSDVRVWNVATGTSDVMQRSAFGPVSHVAFDSTGEWVAATAPASVIVWSVVSTRQLFYLRGQTARPTAVQFAPGAPWLVSSSDDGSVRTFDCQMCLDLDGLIALANTRRAQLGERPIR